MTSIQQAENGQTCLSSKTSKYLLQSFLGQGTFGLVTKGTKLDDGRTVAIKLIKNEGYFIQQTQAEAAVLEYIRSLDPDKCNIVRFHEGFTHQEYNCFVFEQLDRSLDDLMKERNFQPLLPKEIRPIVKQVGNALFHLKSIGIIHADLKLQNVMLVNHEEEPFRVKLIDFGLAHHRSCTKIGTYTGTRPYRAPELILGLPYTEAIDMWALGCMAAYLYLGTLLYPGLNDRAMMRYIVETLGQPPAHMLSNALKTSKFFKRDTDNPSLWKLKTLLEFYLETGTVPVDIRKMKFSSLDELLNVRSIEADNSTERVAEMTDVLIFVNMLQEMLHLDPDKRITPSQLLEHQFINIDHIKSMYKISSYVRSCFEIMSITPKTQTSDRDAMLTPLQQPFPKTAQPVKQHSSSQNSQTNNCIRSGTKRKMVEEDKETTYNQHERQYDIKRRSGRRSDAFTSTSSTRGRTQTNHRSYVKSLSHDDDQNETYGHKNKRVRPSDGSSTHHAQPVVQNYAATSFKRGRSTDQDSDHNQTNHERKRFRRNNDGRMSYNNSRSYYLPENLHNGPSLRSSRPGNTVSYHHAQPTAPTCISTSAKRGKPYDQDSYNFEMSSQKMRRATYIHQGRPSCSNHSKYPNMTQPSEHHHYSVHHNTIQPGRWAQNGEAAENRRHIDEVRTRRHCHDQRTRGPEGQWTRGPVDQWAREPVDQWARGPVDQRTRGSLDRRTRAPWDQRASGQEGQWTRGPVDQRTRGPVTQRTSGPEGQWTRGPVDQWARGPVDQRTRGPVDQRTRAPWDETARGPGGQWTRGPVDQWARGPMTQRARGPEGRWTRGPVDHWAGGPVEQRIRAPWDQTARGPEEQRTRGP